jgi:hypothetical protein
LSTRPVRIETQEVPTVQRISHSDPPFGVSEEPVRAELLNVVDSQLTAFREDDYPKAYTFAASSLRAQLPLPAFEHMVKAGYHFITQSRSAQFGIILDNGDAAVVNVAISNHSGRVRQYQYLLQRERTGWKIFAVSQIKASGTTI